MNKKFEEIMKAGFPISMYQSDDGWFFLCAEDNNGKFEGMAKKLVDAQAMFFENFKAEMRRRAEIMRVVG
jgi:hypothetical protein